MIYLDSNWNLKAKMGEADTTNAPHIAVFYNKPRTENGRDEKGGGRVISQADSYEVSATVTSGTSEVTLLAGPTPAQTQVNVSSDPGRYKVHLYCCNRDTVARTFYIFLESATSSSTERYIVSGLSVPASSTMYISEDGVVDITSVNDHGQLSGLTDDDHTQYALLAGRVGSNQTLQGSQDSGGDLTLSPTSHATKGRVKLIRPQIQDAAANPAAAGDFWMNSTTPKFFDTGVRRVPPFQDTNPNNAEYPKYNASNSQWEYGVFGDDVLDAISGQIDYDSLTTDLKTLIALRTNLVINSNNEFDQRNVAASVAMANDTYAGPDRFYSLIQGANATCQRQSAPSGFSGAYVQRLTAGGTTYRYGRATILEARDVLWHRGRDMTASVKVKATKNAGSGSIDVHFAVLEWTGTADSPTSDVVNNWASSTYTTGNFFISTTTNLLVDSGTISVAHGTVETINLDLTIGSSANNLVLFVWTEDVPAHASDYIEVGDWRLTPGSVAPTIWTPRTRQDLPLCQRYYAKTYDVNVAPATVTYVGALYSWQDVATAGGAYMQFVTKVRMRGVPGIVNVYSPQTGTAGKMAGNSGGTDYNAAILFASESGVIVYNSVAVTASQSNYVHVTLDAEL